MPSGDAERRRLWASFTEASTSGSARRIAEAEDAVFRHYLPWAMSFAEEACSAHLQAPDPAPYRDAAELGLAQAVLAWRHGGDGRFHDFARRSILNQIRRIPAGFHHQRHYNVTSGDEPDPAEPMGVVEKGTAERTAGGVEVALLDREGVIVWVNDAWEAFGKANGAVPGRSGTGTSYLAVCDAAAPDRGSRMVARAIRRAAKGECPAPAAIRVSCDPPDASGWYDVLITTRRNEDHGIVGVAVALSPVPSTIWELPWSAATAEAPQPVGIEQDSPPYITLRCEMGDEKGNFVT